MSKMFLEAKDFNERLNKSIFTNLEKGISTKQLKETYPESQFAILEKSVVEGYILETYKATGGEIIKGGFNDTPSVAKAIANMKEQVSSLSHVSVNDDGHKRDVYVMLKAKEDTLQKGGKDGEKLEKGKLADDLYYNNVDNITFEKTGKAIKEKLVTVKALENSKVVEVTEKLSKMQSEFTHQPTEDCYKYGFAKNVECNYKCFNWNLTYFEEGSSMNGSYENSDGSYTNVVASQEEADFCREWNNLVEKYVDCKSECKAIEVYEDNLEDSKKYKLTAQQMLHFGF